MKDYLITYGMLLPVEQQKKYFEDNYYKYSNYSLGSYLQGDYEKMREYSDLANEFKKLLKELN